MTFSLPELAWWSCLELFVGVDLVRSLLSDDIEVVLLQESEILTGLRELSLFHTLTDIPVHESTLGVHHVVLLGDALGEHTAYSNVVSDHGHIALGNVHDVIVNLRGRYFVEADLESGWAPLDERDLVVLLEPLDGGVGLLRLDGATVVDGDRHVLVLDGVEVGVFDKHVLGLEDVVRDLADGLGLVARLFHGDDRGEGSGHEVETRERHQVGLELAEVDVQLSVESEGRGHRGDHLGDDHVELGVGRARDVELLLADAVDRLVVKDNRNLGVVQEPVGGEHGVVRLHDARGDLGRRVDLEANLRLLAVVHRNALEDESAETGAGTAADGVVDDEALHVLGVINELAQAVVHLVKDLLADGVVSAGEVVGSILLAVQKELRVEHLRVVAGPDIVNHSRLKVDGDVTGDVLSGAGLLVESGEVLVDFIVFQGTVILDLVLIAVLGPNGVTELDTGLADVNGENFAGGHFERLELSVVVKDKLQLGKKVF